MSRKSLRIRGSPPVRVTVNTPHSASCSTTFMSSLVLGEPCLAWGADMKQWRQRRLQEPVMDQWTFLR